MPKTGLRHTFEMQTRNTFTKVECEMGVSVQGKELPALDVLGKALKEAIEVFDRTVKESYQQVPPRTTGAPELNLSR